MQKDVWTRFRFPSLNRVLTFAHFFLFWHSSFTFVPPLITSGSSAVCMIFCFVLICRYYYFRAYAIRSTTYQCSARLGDCFDFFFYGPNRFDCVTTTDQVYVWVWVFSTIIFYTCNLAMVQQRVIPYARGIGRRSLASGSNRVEITNVWLVSLDHELFIQSAESFSLFLCCIVMIHLCI